MSTNVVTPKDIVLGQPVQNLIGYIIIINLAIVVYTAIVFLIGYKCGFQYGHRKVLYEKITSEKMTMTPVTYTFVRGVREPRFDYNPNIGGCWP